MTENTGSVYSNYAERYEAWNKADEKICSACYGTGLDRDEVYDCEACFGEGFVVPLDSVLTPMLD